MIASVAGLEAFNRIKGELSGCFYFAAELVAQYPNRTPYELFEKNMSDYRPNAFPPRLV